ncbi:MAG: hypothetical protein AAB443_03030 [Patescibacteria group bacterium]
MEYRLLANEEYDTYAPELKGSSRVVTDGEKYWYFKSAINTPDEFSRDMLGYILGSKVANIAEVKKITLDEFTVLKSIVGLSEEFNPQRHYLVRVAGSYKLEELKWQIPEQAVASEIVFSVWIRRRDTHVDNRIYINGIPVFFDSGIAFLPPHEQHMGHIAVFSRRNFDHGQPNRWRIKVKSEKMTTQEARALHRSTQGAHHFVSDLEQFKSELNHMTRLFQTTFSYDLTKEINNADFDENQIVFLNEFLSINLHCLPKDLEVMSRIIFRD